REVWRVGSVSKCGGNRRTRSQNKRGSSQAARRRGSESSEGGRRVGRKEQGAEDRCHLARGCERREADEGRDQVHCRQRESESGCRILSETVSRSGLERRRRVTRSHGRHTLIVKGRGAECDHHLLRYGFYAERGQCVCDASGTGSGQVKLEVRSRKEEVRRKKWN